jgi:hypothetical protein
VDYIDQSLPWNSVDHRLKDIREHLSADGVGGYSFDPAQYCLRQWPDHGYYRIVHQQSDEIGNNAIMALSPCISDQSNCEEPGLRVITNGKTMDHGYRCVEIGIRKGTERMIDTIHIACYDQRIVKCLYHRRHNVRWNRSVGTIGFKYPVDDAFVRMIWILFDDTCRYLATVCWGIQTTL